GKESAGRGSQISRALNRSFDDGGGAGGDMTKLAPRDHQKSLWCILILVALGFTAPARCSPSVKPLDKRQVVGLVEGGVASQRIAQIVGMRGLSFDVTPDFLRLLRSKGAKDGLLVALQNAKQPALPPEPEPTAESPAAVGYADDYQNAELSLKKGKQDFLQRHWAQAEKEMRKVTQLEPSNVEARSALGYVLSREGRWNAAIAEYRRALALDPDQGPVHYNLGVALDKEHHLRQAIVEYRRAIKLDANDAKAYYAVGVDLYQEADWPGAAAEFRDALRLQPRDSNSHCGLGLAELHEQNVDAAIPELREALRMNPQNAQAHAGLGGALLRKGKQRAALQEFRVAAALQPADASYQADFQQLWRQLHADPPPPRAHR
ncbi:MAG: tetratricopeptide repeat protein, partial [Terriglobia bacterium]